MSCCLSVQQILDSRCCAFTEEEQKEDIRSLSKLPPQCFSFLKIFWSSEHSKDQFGPSAGSVGSQEKGHLSPI